MLDLVEVALSRQIMQQDQATPLRVEIFSTLDCLSQSEFEKCIPGIEPVIQTPVVGFYDDGVLRETATGFAGRALVGRVCGFDPALTLEFGDAPCATTPAAPTSSAP